MGAKLEIYFNILGNAYIFVRTVPLEVFVGGGGGASNPIPRYDPGYHEKS